LFGFTFLLYACAGEPSLPADSPNRSTPAALTLPTDPRLLASLLGVPPESLRAAGEERYRRDAYDSARTILAVEVSRARGASDTVGEARALMWQGLAEWRLGDYTGARRHGEASLALKRRIGLDAELSRSYNALGLLAWNQGRHHDALENFDSAVVIARRHQDAPGLARAISNIPLVQVELGEYDAAREGFLAARKAGRDIEDDRTEGNALANLAMLEIRLGNHAQALPLLAEARRHYAAIGFSTGEANALGQLATAYSGLGDLQRAIGAADSGIAIARADGLQQEVAATLEVLADLHAQAGNWRLALRRLQEADSLDRELGLAVERGNNLRRTSAILLELGQPVPAISRAEEALATHRRIEAWTETVYDRLQMAEALAENENPRAAQAQSDSALREGSHLDNPEAVRDARVTAARLALAAGNPEAALRHLPIRNTSQTSSDWALFDVRAGALLALGRLNQARDAGERSIAALERERASLGSSAFRSTYLANRVGPFSRMVEIQLARGDTAAAFSVAASLPGRTLAERLGGLSAESGTVATIADGERVLLRAAALEQELAGLTSGEQRDNITQKLEATRATYEEDLAHRVPVPGERLLGLGAVNLSEVQNRLGDDEAMIVFLSGPDRLDGFLIRRQSLLQWSRPIGSRELAMRVRLTRELLAVAKPGHEVPQALGELHDLLLGPAASARALDGISRLLIVPHGPLGALPFAALWDREAGRFLVEDYVLYYLPTVAALVVPPRTTEVSLSKLEVFAPLPDSLPGTLAEARTIRHLVPSAELRLGRSSSETAVRKALEAGRPVHLASHGSHNAQNPLFSRITVGLGKGLRPEDDGRLETHEILGLTTRSPLVFLSGCETGLGSAGEAPFAVGTDEGSLSQALLFAGAGGVVATLWEVSDAGAAELAQRFYHHLSTGLDPGGSLALAQRELIAARKRLTWAAYAFSGVAWRKSDGPVRTTGNTP
jgi:CHAT domain-containing protein